MAQYILPEEEAIATMTQAIREAYAHKPTYINISIEGAVDELPMVHVEYEAYGARMLFDTPIGKDIDKTNGDEK